MIRTVKTHYPEEPLGWISKPLNDFAEAEREGMFEWLVPSAQEFANGLRACFESDSIHLSNPDLVDVLILTFGATVYPDFYCESLEEARFEGLKVAGPAGGFTIVKIKHLDSFASNRVSGDQYSESWMHSHCFFRDGEVTDEHRQWEEDNLRLK